MYNVLIVEDHALIRFGLKTAFESKNFINEIYEASTGEEAINMIKNHNIDAVIMDLGLPSMNGIEATREIKSVNNKIKVIILTSHNSEEEVLDSIKAGANAYCSKDINPDRLADTVLSVVEGAIWFDPKISDFVPVDIDDIDNLQSELVRLGEFWKDNFEFEDTETPVDADKNNQQAEISWRQNYYLSGLPYNVLNMNPWLEQSKGWTDTNENYGTLQNS